MPRDKAEDLEILTLFSFESPEFLTPNPQPQKFDESFLLVSISTIPTIYFFELASIYPLPPRSTL